jgi:hypothetical protein
MSMSISIKGERMPTRKKKWEPNTANANIND